MKKAQLAVLLGFLDGQEEVFSKILRDIKATEPDSSERKSHLGYLLHNLTVLWKTCYRRWPRPLKTA